MIEIAVADSIWFGTCRRFGSGEEAKAAYHSVNEVAPPDGKWHVGIYRHQRIGHDDEPVLISVVGDVRAGVEAADVVLALLGGEETDLHISSWMQLVGRRVERVLALIKEGAEPGRHSVPHSPEGDLL